MTTRRKLLSISAVGGATTALLASKAFAQSGLSDENLLRKFGFVGPADDPEFGPTIRAKDEPLVGNVVGSAPSRPEEVATAFRLLLNAPRDTNQLAIASYFEKIPNKNADGEPYNFEWSNRANPLIVGFFSLTNTLPSEGDQTSWCAAFANFCLYLSGHKGTFSALSGSFRKYGQPTDNPKPGDLVVFSKWGEDGKKGFGHVGFFLAMEQDGIKMLGGNQRGATKSTGAVTTTTMPKESAELVLHSFRQVA